MYAQNDMMWLGMLGMHEMGDLGYFYEMAYFEASGDGLFAPRLVRPSE